MILFLMFRDAFIVGLCNSLTSVFAGVVVFAILGNLANGRPISEIVSVDFDDHDHTGNDDDDDEEMMRMRMMVVVFAILGNLANGNGNGSEIVLVW